MRNQYSFEAHRACGFAARDVDLNGFAPDSLSSSASRSGKPVGERVGR